MSHQRPRGCPSCAIIQTIPSTGLGAFSIYQAWQVSRAGGSRNTALGLSAFGVGYGHTTYELNTLYYLLKCL